MLKKKNRRKKLKVVLHKTLHADGPDCQHYVDARLLLDFFYGATRGSTARDQSAGPDRKAPVLSLHAPHHRRDRRTHETREINKEGRERDRVDIRHTADE